MEHNENDQRLDICHGCSAPLARTALTEIVRSWVACDCDRWHFTHLVYVAWHKACYRQAEAAAPAPAGEGEER